MNIFNIWWVYVVFYLIFVVLFNQFYKVATKTSKSDGALTILLQFFTGIIILLFAPFFEMKFPSDLRIYLLLGCSTIFYTINNRLNTTIRRGIEASTFTVLSQIYTIFMIIIGVIFFKEPFIISKIIGAVLIIFSNFLVFYKREDFKINIYVVLGVVSNLSMAIAASLDISISDNFNLPIYISVGFIVPAVLIFVIERHKISDIQLEFKDGNKTAIFVTALSWGVSAISLLSAYLIGDVTTIAPLCALTVILNVIAGYIFLKERDNLLKKIIAAILIIVSVILIGI